MMPVICKLKQITLRVIQKSPYTCQSVQFQSLIHHIRILSLNDLFCYFRADYFLKKSTVQELINIENEQVLGYLFKLQEIGNINKSVIW